MNIAHDLSFAPARIASAKVAIVAKTGAGKTYTAAVMAEEFVAAGQPFYALDPTGAWWGLRAAANGKDPGLPVVLIGGEHGDVPLEPTAGKIIGDLVVDEPGFYVLDTSMFDTKAEEVRIATAFFERVYREGAEEGCAHGVLGRGRPVRPQKPGPDETRLLHNAEAIVGRGRIRRLGTTLITQRPAILNKNVLTQTDVLIALRITGPRDRAAVDEWVKGNAQGDERAELIGSLAGLKLGEAWVYGPGEDPPLYQRVRVRERRTFNSSATGGAKKAQPQALAHVGGRDRQGRHALLAHRGRKSRARARRPQTGPCRGISKPRSRALSFGSSKAARGRATPTASLPPTPKTSTSTRSTSGAAL